MSIEYLRAKALSYAPEMPYPIILDREMKYRLQEAQRNLSALQNQRDRMADLPPERLDESTPTLRIDQEIAAAEATLAALEEQARPESLVLIFRRLPASGAESYQALLEEHSDEAGKLSLTEFADALLARCYAQTEDADGEDLGLSWAEAQTPLDHGDLESLRTQIIGHHRIGAAVSFDPRNSGRPATS